MKKLYENIVVDITVDISELDILTLSVGEGGGVERAWRTDADGAVSNPNQ